ncbi:hypothetical protein Y900_023670 [Mycolicibacterium aromaticivorans JS19b1 = JCM 16368]|uniref:Uncharacterized protein n=1 Tax=Mycolicibacterium aromaticivorans JS19b1 = JCM 16368 TaxID=1440774 RepID=A0A064CNE0_9MYCO|nr:hypothetical protein Y900_023670 [Mycolicibacterium aromaticivorans JS19b1 = JCM 16368]
MAPSSSAPSATSAAGPYSAYTQSYTVPWVGSPDFAHLTSTLKVEASVNGGAVSPFTVDTGSVGVVVPASEVPNIPADSPPGSLTYSSSGLELTGVWVTASVSFPQAVDATGAAAGAQAEVPVLAVTSSTCRGGGVNSGRCTGAIPHMLGVGFGRGNTARAAPTHNPFLNLAAMTAGTMRRGYLIGRPGLSLGLTAANVTGAWTMQQLTSAGTPAEGPHNDWLTPTGGFQSGSGPMHSGKVLVDTGLLDMIVEADGLPANGTVAAGTAMTITVGDLRYSFAVGDGGPQTPTEVHRAPARNGTFVNTGLRALGRYDLLYDADGGFSGLRPG